MLPSRSMAASRRIPYIPFESPDICDRIQLSRIDINSASLPLLMTLPEMSEDEALKIIRTRPFKDLADLEARLPLEKTRIYLVVQTLQRSPAVEFRSPDAPAPRVRDVRAKCRRDYGFVDE
jgi:hypothetical protein